MKYIKKSFKDYKKHDLRRIDLKLWLSTQTHTHTQNTHRYFIWMDRNFMCFPLNSIQIHTHFGHRMNYKIHALKLNGCFCFSLLDPFDTHNTTYMTILFVLFGCSCACCVSCAVRRIYLIGLCTVKKKRKRKQQEQTFGWFFFLFSLWIFPAFSCFIRVKWTHTRLRSYTHTNLETVHVIYQESQWIVSAREIDEENRENSIGKVKEKSTQNCERAPVEFGTMNEMKKTHTHTICALAYMYNMHTVFYLRKSVRDVYVCN